MVRRVFVLGLTLGVCVSSAQVNLKVGRGGQQVGTARVSQRIQQDGKKMLELVVRLYGKTGDIEIRTTSTFDPHGHPVRKVQRIVTPDHKWTQKIVEFSPNKATVTSETNGARRVKSFDLVGANSSANLAEFWFIRDMPKVGQTVKCFTFNIDSEAWEVTDIQYLGKQADGFHLRSKQGSKLLSIVLDKDGLPVLIKDGESTVLNRT